MSEKHKDWMDKPYVFQCGQETAKLWLEFKELKDKEKELIKIRKQIKEIEGEIEALRFKYCQILF